MNNVHFALPEIYDDSLSYYDVLRKLIKSMHVINDNLNKIPEQIANEAKARLLGDQNLHQNINSEATTREQADTTLQQNINAETSAREQADQEIREVVSDKISELKSDLANKLPKSPVNWEPWTAEEQATAQERIGLVKEWLLKGTLTTENKSENLYVDLSGCTELYIIGDSTGIGNSWLNTSLGTFIGFPVKNGYRKIAAKFRYDGKMIYPVFAKYAESNLSYVRDNLEYSYAYINKSMDIISSIWLTAPNNVEKCNIQIFAR